MLLHDCADCLGQLPEVGHLLFAEIRESLYNAFGTDKHMACGIKKPLQFLLLSCNLPRQTQ